ncbi:oligosaccharide flippase family protein [Paenibacillus taichungensis]
MGKGVLHLFGSNVSIKVVAILFSFYIAKYYGAHFLGIYTLFFSIYGIGQFTCKLGLFYALEKRISEIRKDEGQIISVTILINTGLLLLSLLATFVFRSFLNGYIGVDNAAYYLMLCIVIANFGNLLSILIKAQKNIVAYSRIMFIKEVVPRVFSMIVLIWIGDIRVLFSAIIVGEIVASLYSLIALKKVKLERPTKHAFSQLYSLTKYNAVMEVRTLTFSWIDVWMIGFFLTKELVGIYQLAWQIASGILIVNKTLATAYFPYFSEWAANNKLDQLKNYLNKKVYMYLLFPIPVFFGSLIYSEDIMRLFNNTFAEGKWVLAILAVCAIFRSIQELYSKVLVAMDHARLSFIASTYSGITNIVLNLALVPWIGIEGAAISTSFCAIIDFIVCRHYLKKVFSYTMPRIQYIPNIVASFIMLVVLLLFKYGLEIRNIFVGLMLGVLLWFISLLFNRTYRDELLSFATFRKLRQKLNG